MKHFEKGSFEERKTNNGCGFSFPKIDSTLFKMFYGLRLAKKL